MKLVEYKNKCYLNMDMVQAIYNNYDERYSALVNGTLFEISEKAFNIILVHGRGK